MVTEDYVSFETAKLLKEKGFDGDTNCYYIEGSVEKNTYYSPIRQNHNKRITNNEFGIDINVSSGKMSAPTIQMAMKWLREVHMIGVFPSTYAFTVGENGSAKHVYGTAIINLNTHELMTNDLMPMPTYEDATEAAIKYCLENLI